MSSSVERASRLSGESKASAPGAAGYGAGAVEDREGQLGPVDPLKILSRCGESGGDGCPQSSGSPNSLGSSEETPLPPPLQVPRALGHAAILWNHQRWAGGCVIYSNFGEVQSSRGKWDQGKTRRWDLEGQHKQSKHSSALQGSSLPVPQRQSAFLSLGPPGTLAERDGEALMTGRRSGGAVGGLQKERPGRDPRTDLPTQDMITIQQEEAGSDGEKAVCSGGGGMGRGEIAPGTWAPQGQLLWGSSACTWFLGPVEWGSGLRRGVQQPWEDSKRRHRGRCSCGSCSVGAEGLPEGLQE